MGIDDQHGKEDGHMKKWICCFCIALILGGLAAIVSAKAEEPGGDAAARVLPLSEYPAWEAAYSAELAAFYQDALTDSFDFIYADGQPVEDFAYAFYDIDDNGVAELIKSQYQDGEDIFEVYTLADGVPVCIASAGDRAGNIYIGESGLMWNWGSDGANHPVGCYFRLAEDGQGREALWSIDIVVDADWDGNDEDTEITVMDGDGNNIFMGLDEYLAWLTQTIPDAEYKPGGLDTRGTAFHEPGEMTINDALIFKPLSAF